MKLRLLGTSTGVARRENDVQSYPQQYAEPATVSPQVDEPPASTNRKVMLPATEVGVVTNSGIEPIPVLPSKASPQQKAAPLDATPQV
jgi:hypothetical protein